MLTTPASTCLCVCVCVCCVCACAQVCKGVSVKPYIFVGDVSILMHERSLVAGRLPSKPLRDQDLGRAHDADPAARKKRGSWPEDADQPQELDEEQRRTKKQAQTKRKPLVVSDHTLGAQLVELNDVQHAASRLDECEAARTADASAGMAARDDGCADWFPAPPLTHSAAAVWTDVRWQRDAEPQRGGPSRCGGSAWSPVAGGSGACPGAGPGGEREREKERAVRMMAPGSTMEAERCPDSAAGSVLMGGVKGMAGVKVITASPSRDLGRVLGGAGGRKAAGEAQWIGGVRVLTASES